MKQVLTVDLGGKEVSIETGRLAKQADGSVLVTSGNNIVLVTAVSSTRESHLDFFPRTVEYAEKFYATGKIPGGYFKREGRPTTNATLTARLIDRPIRPCFPEYYRHETQIVATRGYNTATILVKNEPFSAVELQQVRDFLLCSPALPLPC